MRGNQHMGDASAKATSLPRTGVESTTLRDISPQQWRSGIAAWLGWTFDGLELHIYTLVALPFVAELLGGLATTDWRVGRYAPMMMEP